MGSISDLTVGPLPQQTSDLESMVRIQRMRCTDRRKTVQSQAINVNFKLDMAASRPLYAIYNLHVHISWRVRNASKQNPSTPNVSQGIIFSDHQVGKVTPVPSNGHAAKTQPNSINTAPSRAPTFPPTLAKCNQQLNGHRPRSGQTRPPPSWTETCYGSSTRSWRCCRPSC